MTRQRQSHARQELNAAYARLGALLSQVQGREPLLRGSVYGRSRRCGKQGCRCTHGPLHQDRVVAIRRGGRVEVRSVRRGAGEGVVHAVEAWRRFHRGRQALLATWRGLLHAVDALGALRQLPPPGW